MAPGPTAETWRLVVGGWRRRWRRRRRRRQRWHGAGRRGRRTSRRVCHVTRIHRCQEVRLPKLGVALALGSLSPRPALHSASSRALMKTTESRRTKMRLRPDRERGGEEGVSHLERRRLDAAMIAATAFIRGDDATKLDEVNARSQCSDGTITYKLGETGITLRYAYLSRCRVRATRGPVQGEPGRVDEGGREVQRRAVEPALRTLRRPRLRRRLVLVLCARLDRSPLRRRRWRNHLQTPARQRVVRSTRRCTR